MFDLQGRYVRQAFVTALVPVSVVYALEVIDVDHQKSQ
jgi:hypothetical protein